MPLKELLKKRWYLFWIAFTTLFGIVTEVFLKNSAEKVPTILFGWFLLFGVVPVLVIKVISKAVWMIRNRRKAVEEIKKYKKVIKL